MIIIRKVVYIFLFLLVASCSSNRQLPLSHFQAKLDGSDFGDVYRVIASVSSAHKFMVVSGNLRKQGRDVRQVIVKHGDCVVMTADDFFDAGTLSIYFFSCGSGSDRSFAKEVVDGLSRNGMHISPTKLDVKTAERSRR